MAQYIPVFLIAAAASFLQTSIGFGFAVFSMVFLHKLYPYGEAIAMCQAFAALNTIYLAVRHYKHIQFKIMLPLLIPSLSLGILFTIFSYSIKTQYLKGMLGLVLVLLAVYMFLYSDKVHLKSTMKTGIIMGSITGIGNGLFGIAGPPAVLYLLPATDSKLAYLATSQAFFSFNNLANLTTRLVNRDFHVHSLSYILAGWAGVAAGMALGLPAFKHLKMELLKKCIYAFVGINGMWIMLQEFVL